MSGTARKVVVVGDPVLHTPSREVTSFDTDLGALIDDMFATMYVAEGVGLAAPQVGVDLRVFVYDCPDDDGVRHTGHVINPVVTARSDETEKSDEGCLSVPGPVADGERAWEVTVQGVDRVGVPVEVSGTGFFARCLLHETDHLQGILYIDHLRKGRRKRVLQDMTPFSWNAP
jgi:peptide deformylase